jgi:hypothetical protein
MCRRKLSIVILILACLTAHNAFAAGSPETVTEARRGGGDPLHQRHVPGHL